MKLNIINNTAFEKIFLTADGRDYLLVNNGKTEIIMCENPKKLTFKIGDKNRVVFNLFFALIDEFIIPEHLWLDLNCNVSFDVSFNAENECTLYINNIKGYAYIKNSEAGECVYNSVYLKGEDVSVHNSAYSLTEYEKDRKKSLFLLRFIFSCLLIVIGMIAMCIWTGDGMWTFLALLFFLSFTIPSFRKAKRFKQYFTDNQANISLFEEEKIRRNNNDEPIIPDPKDFFGKALYKIFDKFLKTKK